MITELQHKLELIRCIDNLYNLAREISFNELQKCYDLFKQAKNGNNEAFNELNKELEKYQKKL